MRKREPVSPPGRGGDGPALTSHWAAGVRAGLVTAVPAVPAAPAADRAAGLTRWIRLQRWIAAPGGYRIHRVSRIHRAIPGPAHQQGARFSRFPPAIPQKPLTVIMDRHPREMRGKYPRSRDRMLGAGRGWGVAGPEQGLGDDRGAVVDGQRRGTVQLVAEVKGLADAVAERGV